MSIHKTSKG